jgi:hypothetical protein
MSIEKGGELFKQEWVSVCERKEREKEIPNLKGLQRNGS